MEALEVMKSLEGRNLFNKRAVQRDAYEVARRRMVDEQLVLRGIKDAKVLAAMGKALRHEFVAAGMQQMAYDDRPLQVGFGQTISQPLIVAMMTEELHLSGSERILEIGTGSGYQAAVLAELVREVYTVERIKELSIHARKVLYRLRYKNITFRVGDGTLGWPEKAPFDGIIVTAGAPCVPEELRGQLSDGGRLVIPVGDEEIQKLQVVVRKGDEFSSHFVTSCRFVKLIGSKGWRDGA